MTIRVGILGYGNLGRGVECAVAQNPDMELKAVFTRRNPEDLAIWSKTAEVLNVSELENWKEKLDVLILCGGSATDLPEQTPECAKYFHVIDSFDTHAKIPEHFAAVDEAAKKSGKVAIISVGGTVIGVSCGYFGGIPDTVVMRISDICLAFPGLVFAMAIAAVLNGGVRNAVLALAMVSWPKYSRIARSQTLAVRQAEYISAARLAGDSPFQVIFRHILPNILGPVLVTAMLDIGTMMMEIAGLSFLGLGAQPPTAEWGSMMSGGRSMLQTYPWVVLTPGLAIFVSVALFNLLGDTVRDSMDSGNA